MAALVLINFSLFFLPFISGKKGTTTGKPLNLKVFSSLCFYPFPIHKRYFSSSPGKITVSNYDDITSKVLNDLLAKQEVSITQTELDKLKAIPGVKFDLPLNDETYPAYESLVGKPNTRGWKAGVYIFTHKPSGSQYIGSSNSLSRRLDQYFTFKHFQQENSGLLLPLIKRDGFHKFNIEILVIPENFSPAASSHKLDYYFLFLEQYHLLHERFNLNTQRVVNFRVSQGKKIYIYDLEGNTLYYAAKSLNLLRNNLGIHPATCSQCLKTGESYLNFFRITDAHIDSAEATKMGLTELLDFISAKKTEFLKTTSQSKFSKPITIKHEGTKETLEFSSITDTVRYLKSIGIQANRDQIAKYLDTDKPYKGYILSKVYK